MLFFILKASSNPEENVRQEYDQKRTSSTEAALVGAAAAAVGAAGAVAGAARRFLRRKRT
jgi:hypothetical protein